MLRPDRPRSSSWRRSLHMACPAAAAAPPPRNRLRRSIRPALSSLHSFVNVLHCSTLTEMCQSLPGDRESDIISSGAEMSELKEGIFREYDIRGIAASEPGRCAGGANRGRGRGRLRARWEEKNRRRHGRPAEFSAHIENRQPYPQPLRDGGDRSRSGADSGRLLRGLSPRPRWSDGDHRLPQSPRVQRPQGAGGTIDALRRTDPRTLRHRRERKISPRTAGQRRPGP